ncbi:hypothetical protein [Paracraurococcus lichenis]|uniref:Uncharacterized protein n=1 Tax=Paracraurococcus lichenis TaxID=3064888 RepID=A0ABT9EA96_9PROT|nr:hypothetical protein [Paracraurococcus sp. LOR1-02]MDO9713121.1 hypothetical protein [Paracraurococcus sp. LOR1-02]
MRVTHTVGLNKPETVARRLVEHSRDYGLTVLRGTAKHPVPAYRRFASDVVSPSPWPSAGEQSPAIFLCGGSLVMAHCRTSEVFDSMSDSKPDDVPTAATRGNAFRERMRRAQAIAAQAARARTAGGPPSDDEAARLVAEFRAKGGQVTICAPAEKEPANAETKR